ncbi:hypothetical protein [Pseudofrankia saprophytica]|uniref:hypothetical protein n=1 Tax=Pseudofrankia saprophytica TaxID=298655 RepID=UPI0012FF43AC|nr:hypothetical protein [Pseudofrankia saprophytica]
MTDLDTAPVDAADAPVGLDDIDRARVRGVRDALASSSQAGLLSEVFAGVDAAESLIASISRHCVLDHCALLIFPDDFDGALGTLIELGATPGPVVPSVIVKGRLAERYGIPAESLDVRITHATLAGTAAPTVGTAASAVGTAASASAIHATSGGASVPPTGRQPTIEMFMLRRSPSLPEGLVDRERGLELERHVALRLVEPDPIVIQGLRWVLREHAGFGWDGGGYNPHDNAEAGGTSALYFLGWTRDPAGGAPRRQRIEIKFHGAFPDITDAHVEAARDESAVASAAVAAARAAAAQRMPAPTPMWPLVPAQARSSSRAAGNGEQAGRRFDLERHEALRAEARRRAADRRPAPLGDLAPRLREEWRQRLRAAAKVARI